MPAATSHPPRHVPQVMVSSTFTDLREHRAALIEAIHHHKMHANVMEHDDAKLVDVIESSLQMVRDSAAYILLVSQKYGQMPKCAKRNPNKLSITELEFDEAQRLGRPVLLFIMGDKHQGTKDDFEKDPEKEKKLNAFRERAKKIAPRSAVNRVYAVFNSLAEFKDKMNSSLAELAKHLDFNSDNTKEDKTPLLPSSNDSPIPQPPAFYAEPDYIGSHKFVGRETELRDLSEWANKSDPTNLLLFEAIGGNGKSMLTWEWTTKQATKVRTDWAGRFWYSFYERGAIMQDFCQRALAYMTGRPLKEFEKRKTAELKDELIAQLHACPWLLVLDGLERVLVAYHRIDAAEALDDEANAPTDKILNRNPCDAIRDEDSDLLRALAACAPSKILVSSRLTPRVLLNQAGQPIPGAKRIILSGLRPPDAEALIRQCGVTGDSAAIQDYLQQNCDNHPLVIGILAGLIANYLPDRGNFCVWARAKDGGAALDLGKIDLTQRRNHILHTAIAALPEASRQLISTLALVSESVDYDALVAFNPGACFGASALLDIVLDLERRGMLQYDARARKYDLHPVVRSVVASGMTASDKLRYGQVIVNYFSSQAPPRFSEVKCLDDLSTSLTVIRVLINQGRFAEANDKDKGQIGPALMRNLEAYQELVTLLTPYFPFGWKELPPHDKVTEPVDRPYVAMYAGICLTGCGHFRDGLDAFAAALQGYLALSKWRDSVTMLLCAVQNLVQLGLLRAAQRLANLGQELAELIHDSEAIFLALLKSFMVEAEVGDVCRADQCWNRLRSMGRKWDHATYRAGDAEWLFEQFQFYCLSQSDDRLAKAEREAEDARNRPVLRSLRRMRGAWRLERAEWGLATPHFANAVQMARERSFVDAESEVGLALAKFHLGQLSEEDARSEAERLAQLRQPALRYLAMLWLAIGDHEQAKDHALEAYRWAWADGEPYVHRYELTKTTELLQEMKVPVPVLPPYDPAKDEPFPWEAEVRAAIEKLKAEKAAKAKK